MVRLRRVLPRNSQKLLVEKSLPQMCTDAHKWLGCVGFCGKIVWLLRGYGRMPYPPNLCPSVQSVGEYLASETSVGSVASVGDSLVSAWVWQGCHTLLICAHPCHLWENILRHKLLWVLWFLWGDSLVSAWVWQGCHTLLICAHPCNLWETILRQKLLWVLWFLWEDSLVSAWVWQGCHTLLICAHLCNLWENILCQKLLWFLWFLWKDSLVAAWVWQGCHTLL